MRRLLAACACALALATIGIAVVANATPASATINNCLSQNYNLFTGRAVCTSYGNANNPDAIAVRVNCRNVNTGAITNGHLGNRVDTPNAVSLYTCPSQWVVSGIAGIQFYFY